MRKQVADDVSISVGRKGCVHYLSINDWWVACCFSHVHMFKILTEATHFDCSWYRGSIDVVDNHEGLLKFRIMLTSVISDSNVTRFT
jgi:hypothetical protein